MSIRILINNTNNDPSTTTTTTPIPTNTNLTGTVEVSIRNASQRNSLTQLPLVFYGRSKVALTHRESSGTGNNRHTRTYHFNSKSLLFSHSYTLTNPTFQPAASRRGEDGGVLSFPFQILIPTHTEPCPPEVTELHRADVLDPRPPVFPGSLGYDPPGTGVPAMPLPDTLLDFSAHVGNASSTTASASVRYALKTEAPGVSSSKKLWMGDAETRADVPIFNPVTFSQGAGRPQTNFREVRYKETVRSFRLLASHGRETQKRLGFRESMRSVFKKGSLPFVTLGLALSVPALLFLDGAAEERIPLRMSVHRLASGLSGDGSDGGGGEGSHSRLSSSSSRSPSPSPAVLGYENDGKQDPMIYQQYIQQQQQQQQRCPPEKQPYPTGPTTNDNEKSQYLSPTAPPTYQPRPPWPSSPNNTHSQIPNPSLRLTRLTLSLVSLNSLRGAEPLPVDTPPDGGDEYTHRPQHRPGMTFLASKSVEVFEWEAPSLNSKEPAQQQIWLPMSSSSAGPNNSNEWVDLGATLGITTAHVRNAAQQSGGSSLGTNADGSLQGGFCTTNWRRGWGLEWEARIEVAGEKEVKWKSRVGDQDGGGGAVVDLVRGC